MDHGKLASRGRWLLLLVVAAAAVALVLAVTAFAAAPTVTITGPQYYGPSPTASPTAPAPAVHSSVVDLRLQDNGYGATMFRFSNDGGATWSESLTFAEYQDWYLFNGYTDPSTMLDGPHTVTAQFSTDGGTTWGATASATTLLDTQDPVVTATEGYWNNNYPYRLKARDQINLAGVQTLWYSIDSGALVAVQNSQPLGTKAPLTTTFDLPGETGTEHDVGVGAMDYAGNYSFGRLLDARRLATARGTSSIGYLDMVYVTIDRTPPVVKAKGAGSSRWHHQPVTVNFSATDDDAGVAYIQYSITGKKNKAPGAWTVGNSVVVTQAGKHKVWYQAVDDAQPEGNASAAAFVYVKIRQ